MGNRIWWLTLLRGICGLTLGLMLLFWPDKGVEALIMFVGAFALVTGLIGTINASVARFRVWGASIFAGLLTVALGLIALLWPGITATLLIYMIAIWALMVGLTDIVAGLVIGLEMPLGALATGLGLVSVVLALLMFWLPEVGIVAAAWLIGFYFLFNGALTIYNAVEILRYRRYGAIHRLA